MGGKAAAVSGALQVGRKVTLDFTGPFRTENPSTFSDFRLSVVFTHESSGRSILVPGYFAADGEGRDSSATAGDIWRAHFCPPEAGPWRYVAHFRHGAGVAVEQGEEAGAPADYIDGVSGKFPIAPKALTDKALTGLDPSKQSAEAADRELVFVRNPGANGDASFSFTAADEALDGLLACGEFDNTVDMGRYDSYAKHWTGADPSWAGGRGKAVIGAVNMLATGGAKSVRIGVDCGGASKSGASKGAPWARTDLVLGPGGDADAAAQRVFDVSKLDQWEVTFEHAATKGLGLRIAVRDSEFAPRRASADRAALLFERKLLLRELSARFGHHPDLSWEIDRSLVVDTDMAEALLSFMRAIDGRGADASLRDLAEEERQARAQERRVDAMSLRETDGAGFGRARKAASRALTAPSLPVRDQGFCSDGGFSLPKSDFPETWTGRRDADPSVRAKVAQNGVAGNAPARIATRQEPVVSAFDLSKYNDAPKAASAAPQRAGRVDLALFLIGGEGDEPEIQPLQPNARLEPGLFSGAGAALAVEARGPEAVKARSARITLDDGAAVLTAEFAPFAVFSQGDADLFETELTWGRHSLQIEAFDGPNGRGAVIGRRVQSFYVQERASGREADADVGETLPAPAAAKDPIPETWSNAVNGHGGFMARANGERPTADVANGANGARKPGSEALAAAARHVEAEDDLVDASEIFAIAPRTAEKPTARPEERRRAAERDCEDAPSPAPDGLAQKELVIRAMGDAMRRRRSRTRTTLGGLSGPLPNGVDALGSYRPRDMETVRFGAEANGEAMAQRSEIGGAKAVREAAIAAAATDEALMSLLLVDVESGEALGAEKNGSGRGGRTNGDAARADSVRPDSVRTDGDDAFDALFKSRAPGGKRNF